MKQYLYDGMLVLLAIISPIQPMLIAAGILIMADMITGIMAAKKRQEKIQSAEARRTISKMIVYTVAILSGFVLEKYMLQELVPVAKIVGGVIGMVEFKSILENASTIAGQDILSLVIEKLGSKNAGGKRGLKN